MADQRDQNGGVENPLGVIEYEDGFFRYTTKDGVNWVLDEGSPEMQAFYKSASGEIDKLLDFVLARISMGHGLYVDGSTVDYAITYIKELESRIARMEERPRIPNVLGKRQ